MNVFLIYVRDKNFYRMLPESLGDSKSGDERVKVMAMPPLGIQTLAPILRQHGHNVRLFDTCHPEMKERNIKADIKEEQPHVIAVSFLSATTYLTVKGFIAGIKPVANKTPIILGGPFASGNAEYILRDCLTADCVGIGEGEELLPDYLDQFDNPGAVRGLVWRNGSEIVCNKRRPLIQDLDTLPFPDRTSLPIDYIESLPLDVPVVLSLDKYCTMQTSRGCPYHCIYCDIPSLYGGKWRCRSTAHVLGEMQELNDMGYRSIHITDDHFLIKRERVKSICDGIVNRELQFQWGCQGRADSAAIDQFAIMSKANCTNIAFGVEAGTQKVLDRLRKNQTLNQVEHAVSEAKRCGIKRTHGFFVIGSPDETEKDIHESFRFAARLPLDTFGFNRLCVYRGTPLWQEYIDRGIIRDEQDWYKWFKCSDIDPTVLSSETVNKARMKGYVWLFANRIFCHPIITFRILYTLSRYMKKLDIVKLLYSPFRRRTLTRKPDMTAQMFDNSLKSNVPAE